MVAWGCRNGLIKLVHEVTIPYSSSRQVQVDVQCKAEGYRYRCEAKNWVGQDDTAKFEIKVYYSPKIIKPLPEDQNVDENGQVSVRCEAEGYPPPKITWIKLLGNQNRQKGNSMNISDVQRSDHGRYRCVASNGFGQDATAEFKINVSYKPVIDKTASSQNVNAWLGVTTNLSCVADGNPAPRYIWTNSSGIVATSEENGILRVTPQDRDGFGPYTCTVENNKGNDSLDIQLVRAGYSSEHKFTTGKPSSDPSTTRTIPFIVLGSLAGLITMAVFIKFWIGRRHKPPASLRLPPDIDENDFKYDVFVTYSRKDCPWVDEELLCLLRENQVKYCVDHEHFELGKVFVQAMVDSVYQSRKVLAVWSENYASSKYCNQELDYAIQRSFQNNDCSVIVIRLDRTDRKRLPKPLRAKTFLDYSDSVERKGWEKRLIRHLKGPDHTNNATETIV